MDGELILKCVLWGIIFLLFSGMAYCLGMIILLEVRSYKREKRMEERAKKIRELENDIFRYDGRRKE